MTSETTRFRLPSRRRLLRAVTATLAIAGIGLVGRTVRGDGTPALVTAFQRWLESLTPEQRRDASFPFADGERLDWHYTPRRRAGLPLKEMSARQREYAWTAMESGLSAAGAARARDIVFLEEVLGRIESLGFWRDPESYFLSVFGEPRDGSTWGWRFEGHHMSINMTLADGRLAAATPLFLGANPAVVSSGPREGLAVMGEEAALARSLMAGFDPARREEALINDRPFGDIVSGPGREGALARPEGLPAARMSAAERETLGRLIARYVETLPPADAAVEMARIRAGGIDAIRFAWAGSLTPGRGHYFRVHGPPVLIEYDNSRDDANHVHSVWLDPTNIFGLDVLGAHYRRHDHGAPPQGETHTV
jgi:hypothetical protein